MSDTKETREELLSRLKALRAQATRGEGVPPSPEEREKTKEFIASPLKWPLWPHLPMKRITEDRVATVAGRQGARFHNVSFTGACVLPDHPSVISLQFLTPLGVGQHAVTKDGVLPGVEEGFVVYESVDAMLDDGWRID